MKTKPKIEHVEIGKLKRNENNARVHSYEQIDKIASSIREFGWTVPILVDEQNNIIAGHGRFEAALQLRMDHVPVIRIEYLTESQKKAYALADNQIALLASWDDSVLQKELLELSADEFDMERFGFSIADLAATSEQADIPDPPNDMAEDDSGQDPTSDGSSQTANDSSAVTFPVIVMLTSGELKTARQLASQDGVNLSAWCRNVLVERIQLP